MAGLVLLALFDMKKKWTAMRFVQMAAMVESSPMPLLPAVVVDQGRTEFLQRWKKIYLSGILTCGHFDILGNLSSYTLVTTN
jgi:hypothetical protein